MQEIVAVAKRENNSRRNYLVLNRLQAKHVPASPKRALDYFEELAGPVKEKFGGERLLLVGFAETATGIGAALAVKLKTAYMQTTREEIDGVDFLNFTEVHSHAVQQKLVRDDLEEIIGRIDRIVFVEDELTTGNTIGNIVSLIRESFPFPVKFAAASLINGMDDKGLEKFCREDIALCFLQQADYCDFPRRAEAVKGDGEYFPAHPLGEVQPRKALDVESWKASDYINARRLTNGASYARACESLWEQFLSVNGKICKKRILVLGTEEIMYPALFLGKCLEEDNEVICHGTTRSPILVSSEPDYLLYRRYELVSLYAQERKTFVYNLKAYDQVFVVTDTPALNREGWDGLVWALWQSGNRKIQLIRWCC